MSAAPPLPRSILRETGRLTTAWVRHGLIGLPLTLGKSILFDSKNETALDTARFREVLGETILRLFDDLGPVYGKAGQIALSRLSARGREIAGSIQLDRLYGGWVPLDFSDIAAILDREIPVWRTDLTIDPVPLGVASMAQVHACIDRDGREWVLKVLKPHACQRLAETVDVLESLAAAGQPLAATHGARALLRDIRGLCQSLRLEMSLAHERQTIERMTERLRQRRQKILALPEINGKFSTDSVLTIQRFRGIPLSDVVSGRVELNAAIRRKLAKGLLHELLIQVFEIGLFHGDPHAGNLILLPDETIGIFDWGLAGELKESDRKHIAAILKAVLVMDIDRLTEALYDLAQSGSSSKPSRKAIKAEVVHLAKRLQPNPEKGIKPSFCDQMEACLKSAAKLGMQLPQGLLLMAKSLVTIEGLAKGIDPEVPLKRIASPVLLAAARPGLQEVVAMTLNFPKIARRFFS